MARGLKKAAPEQLALLEPLLPESRPAPVAPIAEAPPSQNSAPRIKPRRRNLWLAAHLPQLALEALDLDVSIPAAVVEELGGRCLVHTLSHTAFEAGVRPDMPMNAALALCPDLVVQPRQPLAEQARLASLAEWCSRFTPMISVEGQTLLLEVRGSLNLFGGVDALRERLDKGLRSHGHHFIMAAAPTPGAATLLADNGYEHFIHESGQLRSVLGRMPLYCLGLDDRRLQRLTKIGARTLRDLLRLPRDGLARRFGADLLQQLDRALGEQHDPRPARETAPRFESSLDLYMETDNTGYILTAAEELAAQLATFLHRHDAGISRFTLRLFHHRRPASELVVGLRQPGRDDRRFIELLDEHLKHILLPAPVISVGMIADEVRPFVVDENVLFKSDEHGAHDWLRILEDLQSRFGSEVVQGLTERADHRPERAWAYGEADDESVPCRHGRRPVWLLPQAQPLACDDGHPHGRGSLVLEQGPERIEAGWWDDADVRRDYFIARDSDGSRLWIYRDLETGGWYLHGMFA